MPSTNSDRYSRNEGILGADGQRAITGTPVAIIGLGGLGSHVAQQLAYLGTRTFVLVDHDHVTDSSMNRLVTADDADVVAATPKVVAARRRIFSVNPDADIRTLETRVNHLCVADALADTAAVFGCLDNDLARLQLTRLCSTFAIPLFDLATDVDTTTTPVTFGGRVVCCTGNGCLVCLQVVDAEALARASLTADQAAADERIYGVDRNALGDTGPMVVSINGTVASLAVTEFIAFVTGLRPLNRHLSYYGHLTQIRHGGDPPTPDCYYCSGLWGTGVTGAVTKPPRIPAQ